MGLVRRRFWLSFTCEEWESMTINQWFTFVVNPKQLTRGGAKVAFGAERKRQEEEEALFVLPGILTGL